MCSSLALLFLSLLLLLFLREGVDHEELAISRIPLSRDVGLVLARHHNSTFESLHMWNIDVGLIFLGTRYMGPREEVPDRMDLFQLLLSSTVHSILRNEVEIFGNSEFREERNTWLIF